MRQVLRDHALRVGERKLRFGERYPMFRLVLLVFTEIPLETGFSHSLMLAENFWLSHTIVWLAYSDPPDARHNPAPV
jgi:hypothetical protein